MVCFSFFAYARLRGSWASRPLVLWTDFVAKKNHSRVKRKTERSTQQHLKPKRHKSRGQTLRYSSCTTDEKQITRRKFVPSINHQQQIPPPQPKRKVAQAAFSFCTFHYSLFTLHFSPTLPRDFSREERREKRKGSFSPFGRKALIFS